MDVKAARQLRRHLHGGTRRESESLSRCDSNWPVGYCRTAGSLLCNYALSCFWDRPCRFELRPDTTRVSLLCLLTSGRFRPKMCTTLKFPTVPLIELFQRWKRSWICLDILGIWLEMLRQNDPQGMVPVSIKARHDEAASYFLCIIPLQNGTICYTAMAIPRFPESRTPVYGHCLLQNTGIQIYDFLIHMKPHLGRFELERMALPETQWL